MINTKNARDLDMYDVGVLFAAMVGVNSSELAEEADRSLVQIGYDEGLARCTFAVQVVAENHRDEGDNRDGCMWLESYDDEHEGGLAHQLFMLDVNKEENAELFHEVVKGVALEWLHEVQGLTLFAVNDLAGETLFCVQAETTQEAFDCIPVALEDKFEVGNVYTSIAETYEDYTVYRMPEHQADTFAVLIKKAG
jgi:hypothetical protein